MKYIKTFEMLKRKVKRGDYVLMNSNGFEDDYKTRLYPQFINFIDTNIGKVAYKNVTQNLLTVEYDNVPQDLKLAFQRSKYAGKMTYYTFFKIDDVIIHDEDKEKLLFALDTNKYNL